MNHAAARAARRSPSAAVASSSKQKTTRANRAPSDLALRSNAGARVIPFVQPKLEVNQPGDRFERQADAVASKVIRMPLVSDEEKKEEIKLAQNPRALQRDTCGTNCDCTACAQNPRELQREADSHSTPSVSPRTASTIHSPGAGQPLSPSMRSRIEPHVGADLSHVRVHSDPAANQAATSLHARAFTHQNHIFLRSSSQSSNLQLMAHESTHVVQQGAAASVQRAPMTEEKPPEVQRS
jgi:hypothetical protein